MGNLVRKEQTEIEFSYLREQVGQWHKERVAADELRQYETQLGELKKLLDSASTHLQTTLNALDVNLPSGEFYEECRTFDLRVLWLRKLWNFYREKFDQRDDPVLGRVLRAADEVVWSCFHPIFKDENKKRPAPLPFVESVYSPEAFPSERVPDNLLPNDKGFLQELMNRLPIPLVSLPQSIIKSPWQLVYIGHEVGHHIQYALLDNKRLVKIFQNKIREIIWDQTRDEDYADKWCYWGREIFADTFSIIAMGDWAIWAMVEFETQNPQTMLKRRSLYPSPVVRLALLKTIADRLGLDGATAIRNLDFEQITESSAEAKRDLLFVEAITTLSLDTLPECAADLAALADFRLEEFQSGGTVSNLAADLVNGIVQTTGDLRRPRLAACAAVAAWATTAATDVVTRSAARKSLFEDSVELIIQSRPEGERNADATGTSAGNLGIELSDLLLRADKQDLEI